MIVTTRALSTAVLLVSGAAFLVVYVVGVRTRRGQDLENLALDASEYIDRPGGLLSLVTVPNIAIALLAILVIGLVSRRVRPAVRALGMIALANVLTQLLKYGLLSRPDFLQTAEANTLPSGHTVAFASVLLGLLIVLPARPRPIAGLLSCVVLGIVTFQLLAFGWHRASDVIAGLLLVTGLIALAQLALPDREPARIGGRSMSFTLLLGCGVLLLLGTASIAAALALDIGGSQALLLASQLLCLTGVVVAVVVTLLLQRTISRRARPSARSAAATS
jgi:hypothetical protein